MKIVVWILIVALIILHQDNWLWDDGTLVMGCLPIGLVYHIGISIAAAVTWYLAICFAWPDDLSESISPTSQEGDDR